MSNIHVLYVGNDHILEVHHLKNELTGEYLDSATVSVTLVDSEGDEVAGDTWPKAMSYVTDSNGIYRATMVNELVLTAGARYTAQLTADAGAGLRAYWELECVARDRA